jgi:hypothetical protein
LGFTGLRFLGKKCGLAFAASPILEAEALPMQT